MEDVSGERLRLVKNRCHSHLPSARSITAQSYNRTKRGLKVTSLSLVTSSRNEPIADASIALMVWESAGVVLPKFISVFDMVYHRARDGTHVKVDLLFLEPVAQIKDIEEEGENRFDQTW